jgi:hypothetical protein
MKRCVAGFVALVLVGTLQAAVITNSSFTADLTGWTQFGTVTASQISGGGPDGNGSARLENANGTQNGIVSDLFTIEPQNNNSGYDFSVWITRSSLGTWASAQVDLLWFNSQGTQISWSTPFSGLNGTAGWEQFSTHFDSLPAGTTQGQVSLRLLYGGWFAEFDDPTFAATAPEPASLALLGTGLVALLRRKS